MEEFVSRRLYSGIRRPGLLEAREDLLQTTIGLKHVTTRLTMRHVRLYRCLTRCLRFVKRHGNQGFFLEAAWEGSLSLLHNASLVVRLLSVRRAALPLCSGSSNAVRIFLSA
jgi:hypothetical protein